MATRERSVTMNDGAELWTATSGAGPPLVLCHGGPGLWDAMGPIAECLGDRLVVHRYDQRGAGRSTASGPFTLARFVTDLEALRVHFGHERWLVLGHSFGTALALEYASAHPDRCRALLLVAGTGLGPDWNDVYHAEQERRLGARRAGRLVALKKRARNLREELEFRRLNLLPDFGNADRAEDLVDAVLGEGFAVNRECNRALTAEWKATDEATRATRCRALEMPVLVVHGAGDPRPASALDSLREALPHARVEILEGVGHWPWLETPERFAAILQGFVAALDATP